MGKNRMIMTKRLRKRYLKRVCLE